MFIQRFLTCKTWGFFFLTWPCTWWRYLRDVTYSIGESGVSWRRTQYEKGASTNSWGNSKEKVFTAQASFSPFRSVVSIPSLSFSPSHKTFFYPTTANINQFSQLFSFCGGAFYDYGKALSYYHRPTDAAILPDCADISISLGSKRLSYFNSFHSILLCNLNRL